MKGNHKRFMERQMQRSYSRTVSACVQILEQLTQSSGNGTSYRTDSGPLNVRLKPNEVYAVRCSDDDRYFKTVMIKRNDLSGKFQTFISNVVPGDPPPDMPEVSSEQIFKQMREMNAGLVVGQDLAAFPFRGHMGNAQQAPGNGLVSDLHKTQQKRTKQ